MTRESQQIKNTNSEKEKNSVKNRTIRKQRKTKECKLWTKIIRDAGVTNGYRNRGKKLTFSDRSFNVPHDEAILIVEELNPNLSHLTSGSCASHNFHDNGELDRRILTTKETTDGKTPNEP